jgi:type I restriction enzyme S subunit
VGRKGSAGEVNLTEGPFWPTDVTYFVEHDERASDLRYLFYALKLLNLQKLAKGVKPGINRNDVYALRIPIPSLPEQRRIVAILDEAFEGIDATVANVEKNLANARNLFERCMSSALDRQSDTRSRSVRELAASDRGSIRTGPFGSQLLHGEFVDAGIAVLGIDNVVENRFTWNRRRYVTAEKYASLRRYTVKPGDVLISIMGTCGRCAVVPNDIELSINSKHLCCISLDRTKCIPEYLHAYFLFHPVARSYLSSQSKGSIMDGLNMGIIQEMPVLVPPLAQQKTIAELFERVRGASNRLADIQVGKIALLGDLRQAILGKAFAGELAAQPGKALPEAAE